MKLFVIIQPRSFFQGLETLALVCALAVGAQAVTLVENSEARATIVVPAEASATVRVAAQELGAYLERMSHARLPIVQEGMPINGARIDVGLTQAARRQLPTDFGGDERVWLAAGPDGVTICGGGERGSLFGVYRFLETLGCRWLTPEDELVPQRETINVEPFHVDTQPAFAWRLFSTHKTGNERWGQKLGLNGFYAAESAASNGACAFWPRSIHGVHAYHQIIPAKRYFAAHPAWYPLLDGKRMPSTESHNQLCVTAPGLADEFAANVVRAFAEDPGAPMLSISPNDDGGWCECEACLALDKKLCGARATSQGLAKEKPFMGDRVFWFANEVAGRVAQTCPDKKLLVLAYINYAEPPDTVRPGPNVVPFLCHYAPADYSRAINDPASAANAQFNQLLKRWTRLTPDLMIYSYVSKSMWWRLPRPVLHTFAADIKYLHALGVRRYYCQSSLNDWPLDGPLYYVIAKLLWDPAADPEACAREWIAGMFGAAAPAMTEFYDAIETAVRRTGRAYSDNPRTQAAGLFEKASLDRALAALERARQLAGGDATAAQHVAGVAQTFRYGYWMIEGFEQEARFAATGDPACREAAQAAGQKALTFCNVREAADYVKSWKTGAQLGVANSSFGEAEMKGGRRCWNSDETGPGDKANGWATFHVMAADRTKPLLLEMDVWGESQLQTISINTRQKVWIPVRPEQPLSRKPQWDTLRFRIPPESLDHSRALQHIGFGGGDSQIWVAAIRAQDAAGNNKPDGKP